MPPVEPTDGTLPVLGSLQSNDLSSLTAGSNMNTIIVAVDIEATSANVYVAEVIQLAASARWWPSMKPVTLPNGSPDFNMHSSYVGKFSRHAEAACPSMDWDAVQNGVPFKDLIDACIRRLHDEAVCSIPWPSYCHCRT